MKKISFLVLMTALLTLAIPTKAQLGNLYLLREGFENGIPATWSQENVTGSAAWAVETTGTYPTGATEGTGRAFLRNETTQTIGFVTKLVTPVLDISDTYQPILVFDHAQAQRAGDVDVLRIYYRTSETAAWVFLKEFSAKISNWRTDTITLPSPTATYQIAFEGTDLLGRGIVLDDIRVRPKPTCNTPFNINPATIATNEVSLQWNGSLDADSFLVVLATKALSTEEDALQDSAIVQTKTVTEYACDFEDLEANTVYYVYIRSYCFNEESDWGSASFRTLNIMKLPYSYGFNYNYISGTVLRNVNWTYGSSLINSNGGVMFTPYVNSNVVSTSWRYYSPDTTTSLWFNGNVVGTLGRSASTTNNSIPAGEYAYAATPEMAVESLSSVQVSFWITAYTSINGFYSTNQAAGIIVGAMTDPADFATFVPVDTFYASMYQQFVYCVADFGSYTGGGKFIGFVSNFPNLENAIALDNVTVYAPTTRTPSVKVSKVSPFDFTVDAGVEADSYNVKIAQDTLAFNAPVGVAPNEARVLTSFTSNTRVFSVPDSAFRGSFVNVYVQAVKNGVESPWSEPVRVQVPGIMNMPITYTFEESDYYIHQNRDNRIWYTTSTYTIPSFLILNPQQGGYYMPYMMAPSSSYSQYVTSGTQVLYWYYAVGDICFPYIDSLQNVLLTWNDVIYLSSGQGNATLEVGVIDYPNDFSTFVKVAEFDPEYTVLNSRMMDFRSYNGNGHYVVFRMRRNGTSLYAYTYVDDVRFVDLSGCHKAEGIEVVPDVTSAEISWYSMGSTDWVVAYSAQSNLANDSVIAVTASDTAKFATATISGLSGLTTYFYSIGAVCGPDTLWADTLSFMTTCPPTISVPYLENFESYEGTTSLYYGAGQTPDCWTMPQYYYYSSSTAKGYSPHVCASTTASYIWDGKFLCFGPGYGTNSSYWEEPLGDIYFALPKMNEHVSNLELSFMFREYSASYYDDTLQIGVMTNPDDISTFVPWYTYYTTKENVSTSYRKMRVDFYGYTGPDGHIAVVKNTPHANYHQYFIDDVAVRKIPTCMPIDQIDMLDASYNGATLKVSTRMGNDYQVAIHSALVADTANIGTGESFVYGNTYHSDTIVVADTTIHTAQTYYAYVRTLCSATEHSEWYGPIEFFTPCMPFAVDEFNTEFATIAAAKLNCWHMGLRSGSVEVPAHHAYYGGSIRLYNNAASDGAYAITPEINVDSICHYSITFKAVTNSTTASYSKKLVVGVITDPYDLSTFTEMKSINVNYVSASNTAKMGTENEYTVHLSDYVGDFNEEYGKHLMFMLESGDATGYIFIQAFRLDSLTGCDRPINFVAEATAHEANIKWDGTSDAYHVLVATNTLNLTAIDSTKLVVDTMVIDEAVALEGLSDYTTYHVYAQPVCDNVAGDWSNEFTFTTECDPFQLPFEEDFGSYVTGTAATATFPGCWTKYHVGTTTNYPSIVAYGNGDAKSMQMYHSTSYKIYAVMPRAAAPVNGMEMLFDYRASSGTPALGTVIGVAKYATPFDSLEATFEAFDTIRNLSTTWAEKTVNFSTYTGDGEFIVFKSNGTTTYIDNLQVYALPTCMYPLSVTAEEVATKSAKIAWVGQGSNFDLYVTAAGSTDTTYYTATASPFQINGLTHNTDYTVGVRQHCSDTDQSRYTKATFHTAIGIPFTEDFASGIPSSWSRQSGLMSEVIAGTTALTNNTGTSAVTNWYANTNNNGLQGAHVRGNVYGTTWKHWLITPEIYLDNVAGLTFAFDVALTDNGNGNSIFSDVKGDTGVDDKFIVIVSEDGGATWDSAHMVVWSNDSLGDHIYNNIPFDGMRYKLDFSYYAGKTIRVAFYGESTVSNADNDVHIGNVSLQVEFCDGPTGLAVVDSTITTTQAMLKWDSDSTAASYNLMLVTGADTVFNQAVTDTFKLVTGLQPNKTYTAYLTKPCDGGGISNAAMCEFGTLLSVPYAESLSGVPAGWQTYKQLINLVFNGTPLDSTYTPARTTGWFVPTTNVLFPNDHLAADIYGATFKSWLVSPTIFVDSIENLTLSFDAAYTKYGNANPADGTRADDRFIVAISDNDGLSWSRENATEWNNSGTGNYVLNSIPNAITRLYIDMDKYQGKKIRVAFYAESTVSGNGDNDFHIANLTIKGEQVCYGPQNLAVVRDSLEAYSASVNWSTKGNRLFEYKFKKDTATLQAGNTTDTILSFYNLTPQTDYSVEVRSICDADSGFVSDWATVTFRTACVKAVVGSTAKWSFPDNSKNIEVFSGSYVYPACWTVGNENSTSSSNVPYLYPTAATSTNQGGFHNQFGLRFYNSTTINRAYAILPEFEGDMDTLQLTLWARAGYTTNSSTGAYTDYGYEARGYGHTLLIGSVEDDDIATFKQIDAWEYPLHKTQVTNLTTASMVDPEQTDYWREVKVPLYGAQGSRICIMLAHGSASYDYMFVDSIEIKPCHCVRPTNLRLLNNLPDMVEFAWEAPADSFKLQYADTTVMLDTNYFKIEGLPLDSSLTLKVAAKCGNDYSEYASIRFTTPKYNYAVPDSLGRYMWNFDNNTTNVQFTAHSTSTSYVVPSYWHSEAPGVTTAANAQYEPSIYGGSSVQYVCGYDGRYALRFYNYSSYRPSYVILPPINGMDTMQLSFWARAGMQTSAAGAYTNYATSTYGHSIIVGTLSSADDMSTLDTLMVYTAPGVTVSNLTTTPDPTGTDYWRKVNIDLSEAKGKYIVFIAPKIGSTSDYMFLDNIHVKANNCFAVTNLHADSVEHNSAIIAWKGKSDSYRITNEELALDTIVADTTFALTGLTSNTRYLFTVVSVCEDGEESDEAYVAFSTKISLPYAENFANGIADGWKTYKQFLNPVLAGRTLDSISTPTGRTTGWILYASSDGLGNPHIATDVYGVTSSRNWFVSPSIYLDSMPNLALAFDAALTDYANGNSIYTDANGPTGIDDRFVVVISDDDGATWKAVNATEWNNTGSGDYVYNDIPENGQRYYIDLVPFIGKTIKFAFYAESTVSNADNDLHIGNFTIQSEDCKPVSKLRGSFSIISQNLDITWVSDADNFQIQIDETGQFVDSLLLVDDSLTTNSYSFTGEFGTTYYIRVRALCDSVNTSIWSKRAVTTPQALRFYEGMNNYVNVPDGWTRFYGRTLANAATTLGTTVAESSAYAWRYRLGGNGITSSHLVASPYTSYPSLWIATSEIYLNAQDSVMLSFVLALTNKDGSDAPTLNGNEQFAVVVSPDAGATWDIANATLWADNVASADYGFAAIPTKAKRYTVDLSRYAGQTVKVAFYAYSTQSSNPNCDIHLDDIQINKYEGVNIRQDLCEFEDFTYGNVTIDEENIPLGESVWHQFVPSVRDNMKDTYNTFNLNVSPAVTTPLTDQVCFGEGYSKYGFSIPSLTENGIYKLKLQGVNTCDSIVELNIAILSASVGTDSATICTGTSYMWNGHELSIAGLYADTLVAPSTGCDSIVSFRLFTNDPSETNETVYLCPNATLDFNGQTITAPGDYHYTTTNVHGCDSIVTWHVLAGKVETTHIRHLLCAGETYTDDNFVGIAVAGDYTVTIPSVVSGCDSILNLHLVAVQNGEATDQVEPADLPYQLDNVTIPAGTAPGTYDFTVNTTCGNVTLHVVVKGGDGIDNVRFANLNLAPNPTEVGKEVKILSSFAPGEKFVLEVFDATGAAIYREPVTATRAAITVPGMPVAGIYMVRLTGNDVTYQSKLIVK